MERKYWFPAKPPECGWGWGVPQTWQGWVVSIAYFLSLIAGAILLAPIHAGIFFGFVCALTVALLIVCWCKGEPIGKARREREGL